MPAAVRRLWLHDRIPDRPHVCRRACPADLRRHQRSHENADRAHALAVAPQFEKENDMSNEVRVAGVGMIPFMKPGASETYNVMGEKAALAALAAAGLPYGAVQQVYVGYVYGGSTAGQAAVYRLGLTGVPIVNVNNNCSTGSSALFLARQAVEAGIV